MNEEIGTEEVSDRDVASALYDLFPFPDPRLEETDKTPVEEDGPQPEDPYAAPEVE